MDRAQRKSAFAISVLVVLAGLIALVIAASGSSQGKFGQIRVACVGDSITKGTEYPNDLQQLLGPDYLVGNFGVGGATIASKSPNAYIGTTMFENRVLFQPNIVVIMLGTNDANPYLNESEQAFVLDYVRLVAAFEALGSKPKVWLVLPPPIFDNNQSRSGNLLVQTVIPGIREVATATGLSIIDAYSPLLSHSAYFVDGIHPEAEGARIIADAVYAAIGPTTK